MKTTIEKNALLGCLAALLVWGCGQGSTEISSRDGAPCTLAGTVLTCPDGTSADLQGDPGTDGAAGGDGLAGATGLPGTSCTAAPAAGGATVACSDGTSAFVANGLGGLDGADGEDGSDGAGCTVARVAGGAQVTCGDGTTATVYDGSSALVFYSYSMTGACVPVYGGHYAKISVGSLNIYGNAACTALVFSGLNGNRYCWIGNALFMSGSDSVLRELVF